MDKKNTDKDQLNVNATSTILICELRFIRMHNYYVKFPKIVNII